MAAQATQAHKRSQTWSVGRGQVGGGASRCVRAARSVAVRSSSDSVATDLRHSKPSPCCVPRQRFDHCDCEPERLL